MSLFAPSVDDLQSAGTPSNSIIYASKIRASGGVIPIGCYISAFAYRPRGRFPRFASCQRAYGETPAKVASSSSLISPDATRAKKAAILSPSTFSAADFAAFAARLDGVATPTARLPGLKSS